jgi:hypothetical protein
VGLFEGFVNPALAMGALLASIPLVIHLLNRRRHLPLEWAAMRFVLAAYRKTRRKAQLENLLLLLLRMAAVALLAFAVARPFTGKESALSHLTESRRDLVLVVDGSASTGYRSGPQSVFEGLVERAREILGELDGTRGDRVRLILADSQPHLLSSRSPEDALALLSTLTEPSDDVLDMASLMGEIARLAEEESAGTGSSSLAVRLLSDLQRTSFRPPAAGGAPTGEGDDRPALDVALDRLHELGVTVVVEDHGPAELVPPNLGVEDVQILGRTAGAGLPVEVAVTVANHSSTTRSQVRVSLAVDGRRQPSRAVDVPARGQGTAIFSVVFGDAGTHTLEGSIEGDRLAVDDGRATVLSVPPPVRVLLVNGSEKPEIDTDEVGYLRAVLEPHDDGGLDRAATPFLPTVASDRELLAGELDLDQHDVIVLANVFTLPDRVIEDLEERVARGGALWITLGDEVDLERFNRGLWRPDRSGLSPAQLGAVESVAERRDTWYRALEFDETHPVLAFFADPRWKPYLTEAPVYAFVQATPTEDATVLARLDDDAKSPLLLERPYDRGRVLLWTTSIDPAWTLIPESPSTFIPLVHELLRHAAHSGEARRNVALGGPLLAEVPTFPRQPVLVRPDGSRRGLDGEVVEVAKDVWRLPAVVDATRTGLWTIELEDAEPLAFAVQFDAVESDLQRLSTAELEGLHPALESYSPAAGDDGEDLGEPPARGELWRWFAGACLLVMVLETLWAAWIGRARRIV